LLVGCAEGTPLLAKTWVKKAARRPKAASRYSALAHRYCRIGFAPMKVICDVERGIDRYSREKL
jgi:hypothetical protein